MPMIAMSDGCGSVSPVRRSRRRAISRSRSSVLPAQSSRWSSAIVVVCVAQRGDLAEHVEAVGLPGIRRSTGDERRARALDCGRPPWSRPGAGRRSSPRGPRGSPRPIGPRPSAAASPPRTARRTACGLTRTWWPGPDSSSTVSSQRTTSSWNRGTIAPVATASRVNR